MNVKEPITDRPTHLSNAQLNLLLSADDVSDAYRRAVQHLDGCDTCQSRLTSLTAPDAMWSDAREMLSDGDEPRWEPDTSAFELNVDDEQAEAAESVDAIVRQLLGAPNHPENLGRLGRYDIERVIGSGGMGIVLKAHDGELNRPIAIKLLAPHLAHVGAARERFAREGRAAAAVVHEHVVAIYNVESGGPLPFLVMQYVPGRSLQARVDEDGPLGVEEILRIGEQSASGLAAAHRQGLVHRDVKPSNILLENSVERAILTDFGLARAIDDASVTQTGILAGTPHYMSPEQATGGPIDHRSDLFGLGAVLYFMATGRPPFRAGTALGVLKRICEEPHAAVWQTNKDMPDEISDVIDQLLEKKPARRFASAEEVQQRLADLLVREQRQGLGRRRYPGWSGRRLRPKLAWAAGALALVAVIGGVSWLAKQPAAPVQPQQLEVRFTDADRVLVRELDSDFLKNLLEARDVLNANGRETYYLHSGDLWQQRLDQIERELTKLEFENDVNPE